jgi:nitroimidazol reductase NimA-like FMN-containing flavoprotein (pyridoxamine 5'-phosphate oxidase superfamily)
MKTLYIDNPEEIQQIIDACPICFLGVADPDGTPFVYPMNFGFENGIIYLHSAQESNLVDKVIQNNKVCITFCSDTKLVHQHPTVACSYSMQSKSIMAWGKVEFVEDLSEKERIFNVIMKHYSQEKFTYSEPALRNVRVWAIKAERIVCKSFGERHPFFKNKHQL